MMNSHTKSLPPDIYQRLLACSKQLLMEKDVKTFLIKTLDIAIDISGAERGCIIVYKDSNRKVQFQAMRNLSDEEIDAPDFELNRLIIEKVFDEQQPVFLPDALHDTTFQPSIKPKANKNVSAMCLPLRQDDRTFGILYLDMGKASNVFTREIFGSIQELTDFFSPVVQTLVNHQQLQTLVNNLEKVTLERPG